MAKGRAHTLAQKAKNLGYERAIDLVADTLRQTKGNIAAAERALGISPNAMQHWRDKLEITIVREAIVTIKEDVRA